MATTIRDNSYTAKPQLAAYRYDQLNRIKQMQTYQSITGNAWGATSTNAYKEVYAYDANGNIKTLERYDGAATPVKIDNLTYGYNKDGNGKLVNNRLRHVKDAQSALLCNYDIDNQNDDNYLYDAIGNLTKDNAEGIDNIEWNAYGKIKSITRAPGVQKSNLEFIYDAMGNRVCKIEKPYNVTSTGWLYTFYVRDASGNIMSTYKKTGSEVEDAVITLDEVMLYGSSRLGIRMVNKTIAQLESETSLYLFNRRLGLKRYEMTNHLGNVLTTFTDRKYQVQSSGTVTGYKTYITSAQDYYAFGMGMNERSWNPSSYRFGFNGAEKDNETYGDNNAYDFGSRIYSPRIGRMLSVDPLSNKFSNESPYLTSGNSPIYFIDNQGRFKWPGDEAQQKAYEKKYPHFSEFMKSKMIKLANSKRIQNALNKYTVGAITPERMKIDFSYNEMSPAIYPDLAWGNGHYEALNDRIQINPELIKAFEDAMNDSKASDTKRLIKLIVIVSTILHEYAHKGDALDGQRAIMVDGKIENGKGPEFSSQETHPKSPPAIEVGYEVEKEVYGQPVDNSRDALQVLRRRISGYNTYNPENARSRESTTVTPSEIDPSVIPELPTQKKGN